MIWCEQHKIYFDHKCPYPGHRKITMDTNTVSI